MSCTHGHGACACGLEYGYQYNYSHVFTALLIVRTLEKHSILEHGNPPSAFREEIYARGETLHAVHGCIDMILTTDSSIIFTD